MGGEEEYKYSGALLDERSEEEKQRDFHDEEIAESSSVQWREKDIRELPFFESRDQSTSGTCVAQAVARIIGMQVKEASGTYASMSGTAIYNRRYNKPGSGMSMPDVLKITTTFGATFEALEPSQKMTEAQINAAKELPFTPDVAAHFKMKSYAYVANNMDAIAQVVSRGNPVMVFIYADRDEYQVNPRVLKNINPAQATLRHAVVITDYFLYRGKKYFLVEDSWGVLSSKGADNAFERELAQRGQRMFSEEFVNKRVYAASYVTQTDFRWGEPQSVSKPRHQFNRDLEYGLRNDAEVRVLQDILKYEGLLNSTIDSTGNYLGLTQAAVQAFQRKYGIVSSGTPATTGYGRVGPLTRAKLNELFN